jgi:P-type E1-E2 ATPase
MTDLYIPGKGDYPLHHLVLDVNGTLAVQGQLIEGVAERLATIGETMEIHLLTADTHGKQAEIDAALGLTAQRITPGREREQKAKFVYDLGAEDVVAMGNGGNDVGMLQAASLGIAVMEGEGLNIEALLAADIVTHSILEALDLLIIPNRLVATLRR